MSGWMRKPVPAAAVTCSAPSAISPAICRNVLLISLHHPKHQPANSQRQSQHDERHDPAAAILIDARLLVLCEDVVLVRHQITGDFVDCREVWPRTHDDWQCLIRFPCRAQAIQLFILGQPVIQLSLNLL